MQTRIYRRLALATALLALALTPGWANAQRDPEKINRAPDKRLWAASLATTVKPGEMVRWGSPPIGTVQRLSLVVNGVPMVYALKGKTNACVGYAYGEGVAVRLTDCAKGRRVPYVRVRAVNAGIRPARVSLKFATR
jgi:hypothetical protein